jgi:hypothetical protein
MSKSVHVESAAYIVAEIREFASFSPAAQRFIKCSLDVGLGRTDAIALWARDDRERISISAQYRQYQALPAIRRCIPADNASERMLCAGNAGFMAALLRLTSHDLGHGKLDGFAAYRFLYERLLGASVRPWLPASFCGSAALPQLAPALRKQYLQSISESAATAPGWSPITPTFFPEWVEEEPAEA